MKARTSGAWAVIAVAVVSVLVFLFVRSAAVEAVYPLERLSSGFRRIVWSRVAGAFDGAAARAENLGLKRQLAALSLAREETARVEAENARLRRELGFASTGPVTWIAAGVLSRDGASAAAGHTLRLDRGSLAGVRVGAAVAVPEGLVGQVISVTPHTAEVMLLTDSGMRVPCEVETGDGLPPRGIVAGGEGEFLEMRYLRRFVREPVARTRVITSGIGGTFPRGIEVGAWIELATSGENARFGRVLPSVDFEALEDVFIRREN